MNSTSNTSQPNDLKRGYLLNLARDLASVVSLGTLLLCIHELGIPFMRGFYCDDVTIRYPFKESTVTSGVCYSVGSGLNIALILALEYQLLVKEVQQSSHTREGSANSFPVKLYLRNVYCRLLVWLFGGISSELLTDISKFTAGRLRPHFIDACRPVVVMRDSKELKLDDYCRQNPNSYTYINNFYCTSGNPSADRDSRLSFMSGHSSYSAYSAVFAVLYIQSTLDISKLGLIKPGFQVLILSAAFYTGLTRVSDFKHHWQDVLAGFLQGTTMAVVVSLCLWPSFYKTYTKYWRSSSRNDQIGEELNRVDY